MQVAAPQLCSRLPNSEVCVDRVSLPTVETSADYFRPESLRFRTRFPVEESIGLLLQDCENARDHTVTHNGQKIGDVLAQHPCSMKIMEGVGYMTTVGVVARTLDFLVQALGLSPSRVNIWLWAGVAVIELFRYRATTRLRRSAHQPSGGGSL